jgi:glutathione S-transferase
MSLRIYGLPASRTFRCLWAAEEAGLAYENVPWSTKGPEIKEAAFLALNPNGTIPALADDGFNLFESLAINFYLARKSGRLLPADARGEALVLQWTLWAATECEPHIGNWYYHTQMLPPAERRPEVAADAVARLPKRLQILEDALAGRDTLVGGEFTLADLNVVAVLFRAPQFGLDAYPRVKAWHARCLARPAAQRAIAMREAKAPA